MIETIVSTGIIGGLLLWIGFKLDDKHQVLKVLSLFFAIFVIFMLGKFTLDSKEVCGIELNNTTLTNNITTYQYETYCYNQTNSNTPNTIYKSSLWYMRITFLYVFGFIIWLVSTYLLKLNKLKRAP